MNLGGMEFLILGVVCLGTMVLVGVGAVVLVYFIRKE